MIEHKETLLRLSSYLIKTEKELVSLACGATIKHKLLAWGKCEKQKKMRLLYKNKPLLECTLNERIEALPDIKKIYQMAEKLSDKRIVSLKKQLDQLGA